MSKPKLSRATRDKLRKLADFLWDDSQYSNVAFDCAGRVADPAAWCVHAGIVKLRAEALADDLFDPDIDNGLYDFVNLVWANYAATNTREQAALRIIYYLNHGVPANYKGRMFRPIYRKGE